DRHLRRPPLPDAPGPRPRLTTAIDAGRPRPLPSPRPRTRRSARSRDMCAPTRRSLGPPGPTGRTDRRVRGICVHVRADPSGTGGAPPGRQPAMELGFTTMNTPADPPPGELARALEDR